MVGARATSCVVMRPRVRSYSLQSCNFSGSLWHRNGTSHTPPRMHVPTVYGVITLETKWIMPAGATRDVAKDPKSCAIVVTMELREHAIARVLRESGATPVQVKVGIQLALGKTKPNCG